MAELNRNGARAAVPKNDPRRIDSSTLLGPDGRLLIQHGGQVDELRQTRYGKLILTKDQGH